MDILKGAPTVQAMYDKMQLKLMHLEGYQPHLAIIRVGEKPDDIAYERGAKSRMEKTGLRCSCYEFPENISMEEFEQSFDFINNDDDVDGILLLRPLPKHLDEAKIVNKIDPEKDMDGISPVNMAKVFMGDKTGYAPCTAQAVIELLDQEGINVSGKRVAVIGRSLVVGRPLAMLLMHKNATVTICHTKTQNAEAICRSCDIVVAAAGCAKMVGSAYLGNDATVIDVGINVDENGKLCGDVDFEAIKDIAKAATPVPGGVGSVTTSVLAQHVIRAALKKKGLDA
ncbi:MAG: bifunctional 5,10-methylenetetrahydrofolate dehydrogenase/5,10-methenyltetrahydrofolate cyclohydrolase [Lachnospiraceae bacterium]|nr:bifunctional 5,10-methylenetetrahydrofolate dehydrogenase/5,10-methenyltetrahydrofolate cyclohydrolase [Lachnospiraceae bacterium]